MNASLWTELQVWFALRGLRERAIVLISVLVALGYGWQFLIKDSLEQFVPTQNLAIFTKEIKGGNYRIVAKHGKFSDSQSLRELASNDPLIESLANNPRALDINKVTKSIDSSVYQSLVNLRNELNLSMIIPIFSNQQIY